MTMKLPRNGREYGRWQVTTTDTLTNFQVQLTPTDPWVNATYSNGEVRLLVYGPDFPDTSMGVPVVRDCTPAVRCTDNPEIVIRSAGRIELTPANRSYASSVATPTTADGGNF